MTAQKWPPTGKYLISSGKEPPQNVKLFLTHLLSDGKHNISTSENLSRLIDS